MSSLFSFTAQKGNLIGHKSMSQGAGDRATQQSPEHVGIKERILRAEE